MTRYVHYWPSTGRHEGDESAVGTLAAWLDTKGIRCDEIAAWIQNDRLMLTRTIEGRTEAFDDPELEALLPLILR